MIFRIADTFTASLAKLMGEEQKAVKTTSFDLQMNPANPGMKFHKLSKAKDKNFWSVRVNNDIRLIVHKTEENFLLCYVDHHDAAYQWAESRKLETHPKTGAAQFVKIRETVKEITIPSYTETSPAEPTKPLLFADVGDDVLLSFGVPPEWLDEVRKVNEDTLFDLEPHLPAEATEALVELATGGISAIAKPSPAEQNPFEHPDAKRRFRVMENAEELAQALDFPWEKWAIFLHPTQHDMVEREYSGAAKVAGSAGTGKTVVALHRAARVAKKHPHVRVLVTTFNRMLAAALRMKLRHLIGHLPLVLERIEVESIADVGERLYRSRFGSPKIVDDEVVRGRLKEAASKITHSFSDHFIWSEWRDIIDAWQIDSWEAYRDVQRLGRKSRLPEPLRKTLWDAFAEVRLWLIQEQQITRAMLYARLSEKLAEEGGGPYDFVIVDEAQDLSVAEMRFLAALGASRPDGLFFAGDQGQRIFQLPFSWKSLGVDIRGRSKILRINYRTSHQIRRRADLLLPGEMSDVDGNKENRSGTISAFEGPDPDIRIYETEDEEGEQGALWIKERLDEGVQPHEIAVFVRSPAEIGRAEQVVDLAGLQSSKVDEAAKAKVGHVTVMTMHHAKGLEFRSVVVMACDDEILPLQERIAHVTDDSDLDEVYNTERHLLYVACTRARDHLIVSGVNPASEFLDDLRGSESIG